MEIQSSLIAANHEPHHKKSSQYTMLDRFKRLTNERFIELPELCNCDLLPTCPPSPRGPPGEPGQDGGFLI